MCETLCVIDKKRNNLIEYLGNKPIHFCTAKWYAVHRFQQERNRDMTNMSRNAEYRYFSFTYFFGKACFGLAECVCM